ncbi:hypothetical protein GFL92_01500 [Rhizobium leguminosarum bv. viciae]|nr:hypothetical protein [Rhizobium leguminosarum bv. viciae]
MQKMLLGTCATATGTTIYIKPDNLSAFRWIDVQFIRLDLGVDFKFPPILIIDWEDDRQICIIGPAVNLASRLEKLTKTTKKPVLLSDDFVEAVGKDARMEGLGSFELRGVAKPIEVFTFGEWTSEL